MTKRHLIFLAMAALSSAASAQTLPPIKAANLNKQAVTWPSGLPAPRTILIIAFDRAQQRQVDGWVAGMGLKAAGAPAWYEVPLINNPGGVARWFIDNGMRSGIPAKADRARVVTVYGDKPALMKSMGLPNESVHVLVVERSGKIITRVTGAYSAAGATAILGAIKG
jgi:hypothetical protein